MRKSSPDLEKFSKEHLREQRQEVATEIKEKRGEYFDRNKEIQEQLDSLTEGVVKEKIKSERTVEAIKEIEAQIEEKSDGFLSKIANILEVRRLQRRLDSKKFQSLNIEKKLQRTGQMVGEFVEIMSDRSKLDEAKEKLCEFHGKEDEAWKEWQEKEKKRDLGNVMEQYDVICIHAVHPGFTPKTNSLLDGRADWRDKCKIIFALNPTVSASTLIKGDGEVNMWAKMGVILKGGRVADAEKSDAVTKVEKSGERLTWSNSDDNQIAEKIGVAINQRAFGDYNEFVIQNPKIAGMYYSLDEDTREYSKSRIVPPSEIHQMSKDYGIPLYIIEGGEVFSSEYYEKSKMLVKGEKINKKQIKEKGFSIDRRLREDMIEEVVEGKVFDESKLEIYEAKLYGATTSGFNEYMLIKARENFASMDGLKTKYQRESNEISDFKNGQEIESFGRFEMQNGFMEYFKVDGRIFQRFEMPSDEIHNNRVLTKSVTWFISQEPSRYIRLGYNTDELPIAVRDTAAYTEGMYDHLEEVAAEWQKNKEKNDSNPISIRYDKERLDRLAMHLYGFAAAAENHADMLTAMRAREIASQYKSSKEFDEFVAERIGKDGKFKISKKELPGYKEIDE